MIICIDINQRGSHSLAIEKWSEVATFMSSFWRVLNITTQSHTKSSTNTDREGVAICPTENGMTTSSTYLNGEGMVTSSTFLNGRGVATPFPWKGNGHLAHWSGHLLHSLMQREWPSISSTVLNGWNWAPPPLFNGKEVDISSTFLTGRKWPHPSLIWVER